MSAFFYFNQTGPGLMLADETVDLTLRPRPWPHVAGLGSMPTQLVPRAHRRPPVRSCGQIRPNSSLTITVICSSYFDMYPIPCQVSFCYNPNDESHHNRPHASAEYQRAKANGVFPACRRGLGLNCSLISRSFQPIPGSTEYGVSITV